MKNIEKRKIIINSSVLFLLGGSLYYALEIIFRGYSHYSMFIAGGLSIVSINVVCRKITLFKNRNVIIKAIIGGVIITAIEFLIGILFNIILKENVWDYTSLTMNILGQICIPFTFLWIALSFPALLICDLFEKTFFSFFPEQKSNFIKK